jgi:hypothetical protein
MTKISVYKGGALKIRFKGVYDFEGAYRYVHDWLKRRAYRFHEKKYKDKPDTALGSETEIDLYGEKEVSEYYQYLVEVSFHTWETKDVMVNEGGKQARRSRGRVEIQISGNVITDWQKRYSGTKVKEMMGKFLDKVVLKYETILKHVAPLDAELHQLEKELKQVLKIEAS